MAISNDERLNRAREYARVFREKNSERINATRRAYSKEKKAELAAHRREERKKNPHAYKIAAKKYREKNGDILRARSRAYHQKNKERLYAYKKRWNIENRELSRIRKVIRKYNITAEEYKRLLNEQNNLCAICRKQEVQRDNRSGHIRNLAVDHDHATGLVRGLLCSSCNPGLGHFDDDCERLKTAIAYLEAFENKKMKIVI